MKTSEMYILFNDLRKEGKTDEQIEREFETRIIPEELKKEIECEIEITI